MRLSSVGALAACVAGAAAFKDTSPFFLFSTAESTITTPKSQIQSRTSVLHSTERFLEACSTHSFLILQQSDVTAKDVQDNKISKSLVSAFSGKDVKYSTSVSQVVDGVDAEDIVSYLLEKCGGEVVTNADSSYSSKSPIYTLQLSSTASSNEDDKKIAALLEKLDKKSYTVIYTTTPPSGVSSHPPYEPKFESQEPLHVEMKRQSTFAKRENSTAPSVPKNAPLFEKYQFFTPGLFMGLIVALLLLSILSVALRAVSSLSVSYGAFDKEMGPAAQKKQQ